MKRSAGILLHISSLPSPHGIGTLGDAAYRFVDFLHRAGQSYWQILPLCPCGGGNSPYQGLSAFAGNPYFIDLELLKHRGLLRPHELAGTESAAADKVDYGKLYKTRDRLLSIAMSRTGELPADFEVFCEENAFWLSDYALFMAIKNAYGGAAWDNWPHVLRNRDKDALSLASEQYRDQILYHKKLQYFFYSQWRQLKQYAHRRGVSIIGDLPIYLSYDSADVWAHPELFQLDESRKMPRSAACPPDAFSPRGQLWGNPLYDWGKMKEDGYRFFLSRFAHAMKMYDLTRLDHFRGFESYYAVQAGAKHARDGRWYPGPGIALFRAAEEALGPLPFIAEDLGHLTPAVKTLLRRTGLPGMKILQFAFGEGDEDCLHLPHRYRRQDVVYSGTHDNSTLRGWLKNAPAKQRYYAARYLRLRHDEGYDMGMLRAVWGSVCRLAVVQMQDVLRLDDRARMNVPGTGYGNWEWRAKATQLSDKLAVRLRREMKLYRR